MAFSPNRLVVGSTQERAAVNTSCVKITGTVPPANHIAVEDGTPVLVKQLPEYEGQLLVYVGENNLVQLYVVVDIGGTLTWKTARIVTLVIDSETGLPRQSV